MPGASQRQRLREAQLANQRAARLRRIILVGAAVLAVVLVAVLAVVLVPQAQRSSGGASASAYPPSATGARDGIVVHANPGKPVVALYFDYQCGSCLQFDQTFGTALELLGQTGEIEYVHHTRVFLDQGAADGLSHKAALAGACADTVGRYGPYHGAIWDGASQGPYTDKLFLETLPGRVGLAGTDLAAFRSCYADRTLAPFVQAVEDSALKAGLTETPVITVNGKRIPNADLVGRTGDDLKQLIEDAAKG